MHRSGAAYNGIGIALIAHCLHTAEQYGFADTPAAFLLVHTGRAEIILICAIVAAESEYFLVLLVIGNKASHRVPRERGGYFVRPTVVEMLPHPFDNLCLIWCHGANDLYPLLRKRGIYLPAFGKLVKLYQHIGHCFVPPYQ